MPIKTKKIYICEDHHIFISGLKSLIDATPGMEVVGWATNGLTAKREIPTLEIDVILLDLNLPGISGFELAKEIRYFNKSVVFIALTMYDDQQIIKKAKNAGANAYLLKDVPSETLIETIQTTTNHDFKIQKGLTFNDQEAFTSSFVNQMKLTKREKQIIQLILDSKTTNEIADELHVSVSTIETHRRNIYIKLKVKNVKELIKLGLNNNLT